MSKIPTIEENPKGLHGRYVIRKVTGYKKDGFYSNKVTTKAVDKDAEYFVMRLDTGGKDIKHITACRIGIHAYADAIYPHLPELATDLKTRYPLL